jgi:predicted transcriptional regulator
VDIEHTREELGETVEALAAKTDVKRQAEAKIEDTKHRVSAKVDALKRTAADNPAAVRKIGIVAAGLLIGVILMRR